MPLNVISSRADIRITTIVETKCVVTGRADIEKVLALDLRPTTLDLIGHSISGQLELGDWVIDDNATAWFRIQTAALRRFKAVRFLGCHTAVSAEYSEVAREV